MIFLKAIERHEAQVGDYYKKYEEWSPILIDGFLKLKEFKNCEFARKTHEEKNIKGIFPKYNYIVI